VAAVGGEIYVAFRRRRFAGGMRGLLCHALIVTTVLFGGDFRFNGGQDTEALVTALRADLVPGRAQLQAHHFNETVDRQLAVLILPAR
jgi:hypothetical protein